MFLFRRLLLLLKEITDFKTQMSFTSSKQFQIGCCLLRSMLIHRSGKTALKLFWQVNDVNVFGFQQQHAFQQQQKNIADFQKIFFL